MAEKPFENPLPADLPENWTAGQIVAPTGEEVGLSRQHGYNYLMEMVNRAHLSINIVNKFVEDLADGLKPLENWYETSLPATISWSLIAYGNGKFVILGDQSRNMVTFAYSEDAVIWSESITITTEKQVSWTGLAFGAGKFVAIGSTVNTGNSTFVYAYSVDGVQWTYQEPNIDGTVDGVIYGNGKFVTINGVYSLYSEDGINWNKHKIFNDFQKADFYLGISFGGGKFVTIGESTGRVLYSTDGISWEEAPKTTLRGVRNIAYGAGKFVATGSSMESNICSVDGINWEPVNIPGGDFNDVSFGYGGFVAVGTDPTAPRKGAIAYSKDGINWHAVNNPPPFHLRMAAYGNGRFAAINSDAFNQDKAVYSGIIGDGQGAPGAPGHGIPAGGAAGQILSKKTAADYDTQWVNPPEGGSGGVAGVSSFKGRTGAVQPAAGDYTAVMVGARPSDWMPAAVDVGARPDTWTPTAVEVGAVSSPVVTEIQVVSQAEYDALANKSASVLYAIKE